MPDNHSIGKAMTTYMTAAQALGRPATMIAAEHATAGGCAGSNAARRGASDWIGLAAAPTFAIMALLSGVLGGGSEMFCATAHDASALSGMVPMYVLMSVFHSAPWLMLISSRRSDASKSSGLPPHL